MIDDLVYRIVRSYQGRMANYAGMGILDTWYDAITFERLMAETASPQIRKSLERGMARATRRASAALLPKLSERVGERWRIRDAPPGIFHIQGENTLFSPEDDWMKITDTGKAFDRAFRNTWVPWPPTGASCSAISHATMPPSRWWGWAASARAA
ncbi:DUF2252 family protein [Cupriavidus basilensis]